MGHNQKPLSRLQHAAIKSRTSNRLLMSMAEPSSSKALTFFLLRGESAGPVAEGRSQASHFVSLAMHLQEAIFRNSDVPAAPRAPQQVP